MQRPHRSVLTRHWLDYLGALHDAVLATTSEQAIGLRQQIAVVENELVRRGLPPHVLEQPNYLPEPTETVAAWRHPEVQALFGEALTETGQKYRDERMVRLGWAHQQIARAAGRASQN